MRSLAVVPRRARTYNLNLAMKHDSFALLTPVTVSRSVFAELESQRVLKGSTEDFTENCKGEKLEAQQVHGREACMVVDFSQQIWR